VNGESANAAAPAPLGLRLRGWLKNVRSGDLGALPVLVGLFIMALVFQALAPTFLSARNLGDLAVQIVPTGLISLGVVLVLLLGEVDLSAGSVSGFAAALMAVLSVGRHVNPVLAMAAGVAVGAAIGALQGWVSARLGVPSFVVTLAGLIGWQGALLHTLGDTGTINIPYGGTVAWLANTYVEDLALGYAIAVAPAVVYGLLAWRASARRGRLGLPTRAPAQIVARTAALAAIALAGAYVLGRTRGVPLALIVFIGLVLVVDFVLRRTRYGRHVFAVGGNAEAARRAGISVTAVRVSVFAIASAFAALGGLMQASRLFAVNQSSGSGDVLLNAIAAAVIGGTSLFGGRGSPWSAPLGMLVIGSIQSGILLLNLKSDAQYMITGAVLLVAVTVDSISRRGRLASGRG
jgi:D-xylose transport system permease protein